MVVCENKYAYNFDCCVMDGKKCSGENCMAWTKQLVPAENQPDFPKSKSGFPIPPPKTIMVETGLGYCGRCRNAR